MELFHLSENVFVIAQNRLVFSIISLHGIKKSENLRYPCIVHQDAYCTAAMTLCSKRLLSLSCRDPRTCTAMRYDVTPNQQFSKKNILSRKKVFSKNKISSFYKRYFVTIKKHFPQNWQFSKIYFVTIKRILGRNDVQDEQGVKQTQKL